MKPDINQQKAVTALGANIVVSASAGAGKTGVLTERFMKRCLIDRVPVNRILAITFTKAAASEMKKRISLALHAAYENKGADKDYIHDQIVLLAGAEITTIDAFCLSLIRKYAGVINLDPSSADNVLSSGIVELYNRQAFTEVLREAASEDPEAILDLLTLFSPRPEDTDTLYEVVRKIALAAKTSVDSGAFYDNAAGFAGPIRRLSDLAASTREAFFGYFLDLIARISNALEIMKRAGEGEPKIDTDLIEARLNAFANCRNALLRQSWSGFVFAFSEAACFKTSPGTHNPIYKKAREQMLGLCKKAGDCLYDEDTFVSDHNACAGFVKNLLAFTRRVEERFSSIKKENGGLDFTDMESYALQILSDPTARRILQKSYDEIMVDEFQDTSPRQNAIIEAVSSGANIFRVGDVKQSIYRFRGARPSIMTALLRDPANISVRLTHNYRSSESLVLFANDMFARLMNIEDSANSYLPEDEVSVGLPEQKEDRPEAVEFALIRAGGDDDSGEEETPDAKQLKAAWISQKMIRMKKENPDLNWGDFAVLMRSHADKLYLKYAFDLYGIPYDIDARTGFFNSQLCLTIRSLLKAVLFDKDGVALLSLCTSGLFGLSDEELSSARLAADDFIDGLRKTHGEVFDTLADLRQTAFTEGLLPLLAKTAATNDFYDRLSQGQKANFDYLFEIVNNAKPEGPQALLDMMEAGSNENSSEALSSRKDEACVKVTTIHQAKGMEYEIVFLWGTSHNPFVETRDPLMVSDEGLLGFNFIEKPYRIVRPTLSRLAAAYRNCTEDIDEFVRLVYVAVTRARKKLFVVDVWQGDYGPVKVDRALLSSRQGISSLFLKVTGESPYFKVSEIMPGMISDDYAQAPASLWVEHLPELSISPATFAPVSTPSAFEPPSLKPLTGKADRGTAYGTSLHEVMAKLPDEIIDAKYLDSFNLTAKTKQRVLTFINSDLYARCLDKEIHREMPFYAARDGIRIEGVMDLCAVGETEIILIDYKTDALGVEEIKELYAPQLNTYRAALKILWPDKRTEVYAYSFHNDCPVIIDPE